MKIHLTVLATMLFIAGCQQQSESPNPSAESEHIAPVASTSETVELQAPASAPDAVPVPKEMQSIATIKRINQNLTLAADDLQPEDFDALAKATAELAQDVETLSATTPELAPVAAQLKQAASFAQRGADAKNAPLTAQAQKIVRSQSEKIANLVNNPTTKEQ